MTIIKIHNILIRTFLCGPRIALGLTLTDVILKIYNYVLLNTQLIKKKRTSCPHDEREFPIDRKRTKALGYLREYSGRFPFFFTDLRRQIMRITLLSPSHYNTIQYNGNS